jgi:hypothetical protein
MRRWAVSPALTGLLKTCSTGQRCSPATIIEKGEIEPLVAKTFPLEKVVETQREFTEKKHVGKFVLIPPPVDDLQQLLRRLNYA